MIYRNLRHTVISIYPIVVSKVLRNSESAPKADYLRDLGCVQDPYVIIIKENPEFVNGLIDQTYAINAQIATHNDYSLAFSD